MTVVCTDRVVSFNIQWGGQTRCARIADAIAEHKPEHVVLTEYQPSVSDELVERLTAQGLHHHALSTPIKRCGGVAILSRRRLQRLGLTLTLQPFEHRIVAARTSRAGRVLIGIYGILDKEPSDAFWTATLDMLAGMAQQPVLVTGDFNTGESEVDTRNRNFFCSQYFTKLSRISYEDLWRRQHGRGAREYSWHHQMGGMFRLDHAFGTKTFARKMLDCRYSHAERESGVSDHSLMVVDSLRR